MPLGARLQRVPAVPTPRSSPRPLASLGSLGLGGPAVGPVDEQLAFGKPPRAVALGEAVLVADEQDEEGSAFYGRRILREGAEAFDVLSASGEHLRGLGRRRVGVDEGPAVV